jgi:hypothetical protein
MYTHISWSIEILVSFVSISPINSHRRLANTFSFVRVHTSITINMDIDSNLLLRLNNAGQGHLVSYWDQLDHEQRAILIRDIMNVDLDHVSQAFHDIRDQLIDQSSNNHDNVNIEDIMEPIPEHRTSSIETTSKEQLDQYRHEGQPTRNNRRASIQYNFLS